MVETTKAFVESIRFSKKYSVTFLITILFISLGLCVSGQNNPISIRAVFEPNIISLSNSSIYKVIIEGTQSQPRGKIPFVEGLNLNNNPQTFRKVSLNNGQTSIRLELNFRAKPTRQGDFTLPEWQMVLDGSTHKVPPTTLQVLSPSEQDIINQKQQIQKEDELKRAAFIEFSMPREYYFEGESIVSKISLYLWDQLPFTRIENVPTKKGDAFSMTELGQPQESRNILKFNKSYSTYSWMTALTATNIGEHTLSYFANLRMRTTNRRSSPFNSPFFNDPFFGFGREESIRVNSPEKKIVVKSLPMKDRPSSFKGAIGTFVSSISIDAEKVSEGDPIRLTFSLSGKGNFSAMPAPTLALDENFKVGPPAFSFDGDQLTKSEGTQHFEYILTPLNAGVFPIPKVNFSFFDPLEEKYQIPNLPSQSIRVDPGERWLESNSPVSLGTAKDSSFSAEDLFQTQSEPGLWVESLRQTRLHKSSTFWFFQLVPLGFLSIVIFWGVKKRKNESSSLNIKEKQLLKTFRNYYSNNDQHGFFKSFRNLIQIKVAQLSDHPNPSSLSNDELNVILIDKYGDSDLVKSIDSLLKKLDDFEFAGNEHSKINLKSEFKDALGILKAIK